MRRLHILVLAVLAAPCALALPGPTAASYAWGAQLTVAGYDVAKPALTNFPVLVRIAENLPNGFSYAQVLSPDGADLCFIDMLGNGLPFEIDTWDTNGTSFAWVTLPTMGQGTQFVMCWGSATTGCEIDVPVRLESGAAKLRIAKAGSFCNQKLYLNDHAGAGPKFIPAAGSTERVYKLYVNGANLRRGYYGSSESDVESLGDRAFPAFVDDEHFSGTGCIKVLTDDVLQPTLLFFR